MRKSREKGSFHIQIHRTVRPVLTNGKRPQFNIGLSPVSPSNAPTISCTVKARNRDSGQRVGGGGGREFITPPLLKDLARSVWRREVTAFPS